MNAKNAPTPSSTPAGQAGFLHRTVTWVLKPVAFTTGLVARLWARRSAAASAAQPTRLTRREEKRRRKELWRSTSAGARRRRAA